MTLEEALQLLELSTPFTRAQLKMAYGQALKVWHPDRFQAGDNLHAKAHEKTRLIIDAFGFLLRALGTNEFYPPTKSESPRHAAREGSNSQSAPTEQAPQKSNPPSREAQPIHSKTETSHSTALPMLGGQNTIKLTIVWLWVAIPLGWGVMKSVQKSAPLFSGSTASAPAKL